MAYLGFEITGANLKNISHVFINISGTTMKNITAKQLEKLQIKIFLIKKTTENVEVISKTRGLKRNEKLMIKIQKRNLVVRVVKSLLLAQRRNLVVINLLLPLVEIRTLVEILVEEQKEISKIGQLKALKLNSECQLNRNRNFSRNRILNEKLNRFSQLIITKMKNCLLFVYFYETIALHWLFMILSVSHPSRSLKFGNKRTVSIKSYLDGVAKYF